MKKAKLLRLEDYSYIYSEKLHFSASNLDRIIFSNVHRLPRKTSAITSSSVTAPPIVVNRDHERPELYLQPSFPFQTV